MQGSGEGDSYFRATILLLNQYRRVDAQVARRLLAESGQDALIETEGEYTHVLTERYMCHILFKPMPYIPKEELAHYSKGVKDLRLRDALMSHTAFLSVFVDEFVPKFMRASSEAKMLQLAGALVDDSVLAIWDSGTNHVVVPTDENVALLAQGDHAAFGRITWDAIGTVGPTSLSDEMDEARRRFPEFRARFEEQGEEETSILKFAFAANDGGVEHIWMRPKSIDGNQATGELLNEPRAVPGLKLGSTVTKSLDELSDWLYVENGNAVGAFTERKVRQSLGN